jgi:hypothetical protein
MTTGISRREMLAALAGGAVPAWSLTARAQQSAGVRRIGVLMPLAAHDTEGQARLLGSNRVPDGNTVRHVRYS